ncbi:MAG: hypothetical protein ACYDB1_02400 [Acidiferrobacteraceae bacterium]
MQSTGSSTVINAGTITGGIGNGGTGAQAGAVNFSGGGNTLDLESGYVFNGNVVSTSGTTNGGDTLALGGATNSTFSLGNVSSTAPTSYSGTPVYYGFNTLEKTGTSTWTVTNPNAVIPHWVVQQGVLTVQGNYAPTTTDSLAIAITPVDTTAGVNYGQLNVTGTATLQGQLIILDAGTPTGYTVGEQYDIVHAASGVTGTFAQTIYNPAFAAYLTPQVSYGAHDVTLALTATPSVQGGPGLAFTSGAGVADNPYIVNQSLLGAFSTVLDGAQSLGGTTPHFTALHQGAWLKGIGDSGQANGASVADFGGITGDGQALSRHLVVGAAFSGLGATTTTAQQTLNGQSFGFYGYGIYTRGALRVSASVGAGALSQDSQRNLAPTGLVATGSTSGWFTDSGVQAQYLIPRGRTFLMPYASATYLHAHLNGFSEQGAGSLDLAYGGETSNLGVFTGGLRTGIDLTEHTLTVIPWVELGGTGTLGNRALTTSETLGLTQATTVSAIAPAASLDVGAGVTVTSHGPWAVRLAYGGAFGGPTYLNTFNLLGRYRF